MKYKAIFLDVDGVLVDSEKLFNICWRKAAEKEGYKMTFEQALELRSLDSQLAKELFKSWYGDDRAYPAIRDVRKRLMSELILREPITVKNGVKDLLNELKTRNIKAVIVTSSPISRITKYIESIGIDIKMLDEIITTENVKRGKPFPDVYQYACKTLGYKPTECIAVEDSPNGVKSANSAGCFTIMIPDLSPYTKELSPIVDMKASTLEDVRCFLIDNC